MVDPRADPANPEDDLLSNYLYHFINLPTHVPHILWDPSHRQFTLETTHHWGRDQPRVLPQNVLRRYVKQNYIPEFYNSEFYCEYRMALHLSRRLTQAGKSAVIRPETGSRVPESTCPQSVWALTFPRMQEFKEMLRRRNLLDFHSLWVDIEMGRQSNRRPLAPPPPGASQFRLSRRLERELRRFGAHRGGTPQAMLGDVIKLGKEKLVGQFDGFRIERLTFQAAPHPTPSREDIILLDYFVGQPFAGHLARRGKGGLYEFFVEIWAYCHCPGQTVYIRRDQFERFVGRHGNYFNPEEPPGGTTFVNVQRIGQHYESIAREIGEEWGRFVQSQQRRILRDPLIPTSPQRYRSLQLHELPPIASRPSFARHSRSDSIVRDYRAFLAESGLQQLCSLLDLYNQIALYEDNQAGDMRAAIARMIHSRESPVSLPDHIRVLFGEGDSRLFDPRTLKQIKLYILEKNKFMYRKYRKARALQDPSPGNTSVELPLLELPLLLDAPKRGSGRKATGVEGSSPVGGSVETKKIRAAAPNERFVEWMKENVGSRTAEFECFEEFVDRYSYIKQIQYSSFLLLYTELFKLNRMEAAKTDLGIILDKARSIYECCVNTGILEQTHVPECNKIYKKILAGFERAGTLSSIGSIFENVMEIACASLGAIWNEYTHKYKTINKIYKRMQPKPSKKSVCEVQIVQGLPKLSSRNEKIIIRLTLENGMCVQKYNERGNEVFVKAETLI